MRFKALFGEVEIESPYLRSSPSGESARPMKDVLGIEGEPYREAVQRALVLMFKGVRRWSDNFLHRLPNGSYPE